MNPPSEASRQERPRWVVSIVSHGHGAGVSRALSDLHRQLEGTAHRFVLTLNAGEDEGFVAGLPPSIRTRLDLVRNATPRGFGANHNAALRGRDCDFVLAADPDLAAPEPIFELIEGHLSDPRCGIVSPLAQTPDGRAEDNGRALVTPERLLRRYLRGRHRDAALATPGTVEVDWLAGLFMAMRADTFERLGGFDEGYYLYCEDVDLCLRARHAGLSVRLLCDTRITHAANRSTLKNLHHLRWHVGSLIRLWRSPAYRRFRMPQR